MRFNTKLDFDDTKVAFGDRSNVDLRRMYFLFSTMNRPWVAKVGIVMMQMAFAIHLPIKLLIKKTIFNHFCGGESLQDSKTTVDKLGASRIHTILDYSVEGEHDEATFDFNKSEIIRSLELAKGSSDIPSGVMKLTGFTAFDLLLKKQSGLEFSIEEAQRWKNFLARVDEVCAMAVSLDKMLFIDGEESWIQDPIDEVVIEMMRKYNRDKVYIFNTYQMYKRASFANLKINHSHAEQDGYRIGAKLVRGAYMEKERERAMELGYDDPIHATKVETDEAFDSAVSYCMRNLETIALCAGTHNEHSSRLLTELVEAHEVKVDDARVYFAQLFGMSDNISYALAQQGYNVAKYVPYGPVRKVLPYLMRRAEENTAMAGQSSREFKLVKAEMRRRKKEDAL
ncbi:MAG: proline dehydrogenase family protein [Reichenbachiella sp.]